MQILESRRSSSLWCMRIARSSSPRRRRQCTERELQFDSFGVMPRDIHIDIDRSWFRRSTDSSAPENRQPATNGPRTTCLMSMRAANPAQTEKHRQGDQPPVLDFIRNSSQIASRGASGYRAGCRSSRTLLPAQCDQLATQSRHAIHIVVHIFISKKYRRMYRRQEYYTEDYERVYQKYLQEPPKDC